MPDALQLLRQDHNKVKDLFQRFEKSQNRSEKKKIAEEAIKELEVHAQIEEEIFYPSMKKALGDIELLHEAEEEHHVADVIMEELKSMRLSDKSYDAKFTVLAENVKHHIGEEEGQMFPKAQKADGDTLDRIGQELMDRKQELMGQKQPQKRRAAAGSRNGGGRAGRTTRTTARSRAGAGTRASGGGASKTRGRTTRGRASSGRTSSGRTSSGRTASGRTTAGRRTASTATRGGTSAASRARSGGTSRGRTTTAGKRASTKRSSTQRSRR